MSGELVLVTGGSGFLGSHAIVALLDAGYRVRTTVRSLSREADVRAMVALGRGAQDGDTATSGELTVVAADLLGDAGWPEAVADCDYVLHMASPFPVAEPKDADELIRPAREGALRVLAAARDAGVKRVVLTSSFAAVGYSPKQGDGPYTEDDWTDAGTPGLSAYVRSKTLAERAAWDFVRTQGGTLELAVVNPVGILGPVLAADYSSSIRLLDTLLTGQLPAVPNISFSLVDVRDVVDLHLRAMTNPAAAGERFLAVSGSAMSMPEIARMLRAELPEVSRRVPRATLPDWLLRFGGLFSPMIRGLTSQLGRPKEASNAKALELLGWMPRPNREAIEATIESLDRLGLLKK